MSVVDGMGKVVTDKWKWPAKPGHVRYRVTVRQVRTNENIGVLRYLTEPSCTIPVEWLTKPDETSMSVQVVEITPNGGGEEWVTWVPFFVLGEPDEVVAWIDSPVKPDGFPIRIMVRPIQGDSILLDEARCGERFPLRHGLGVPKGTRIRYKFMRYDHATRKWVDLTGYLPLVYGRHSASTSIRVRETGSQPVDGADHRARQFFFTVDVEINMRHQRLANAATAVDEHIFGITPGGGNTEYGIRYIMDALDARGMKGTFFVDVLMEYQVGEDGLRRALDAILEQGHDVQLHLHPNPNLQYAKEESLRRLGVAYSKTRSIDSFRSAMDLAVGLFERRTGHAPVAFRNGSYIFQDEYFPVLREYGIRFDSSLYAFKNSEVSPWLRARSMPFMHRSGVMEIPVTWAIEIRGNNKTSIVQHTIKMGRQGTNLNDAMRAQWAIPPAALVTLIHSYTLLEGRKTSDQERLDWNKSLRELVDENQYKIISMSARYAKTTMDGPLNDRLTSLNHRLDMVAGDSRIQTHTFSDLAILSSEQLTFDAVIDPVFEYDVRSSRPRPSGLQRYNGSYLQYLDAKGSVRHV